jgi:hypothetical protein
VSRVSIEDRELIIRCLMEALDGRYFPDWEFPVLMPFSRDDLRSFLDSNPALDELPIGSPPWTFVCCVLNNLTGYPHGLGAHLERQVGASLADLDLLHERLSGESR